MIELKQKVTHPTYGVGIVANTKENGQFILVDYKGVAHWSHKDQLKPFRGNSFHKVQTPANLLQQLSEKIQEVQKFAEMQAKQLETGQCTLHKQVQANVHKVYAKMLNEILNNK
jgi:hypothetical protein